MGTCADCRSLTYYGAVFYKSKLIATNLKDDPFAMKKNCHPKKGNTSAAPIVDSLATALSEIG